MIVPMRKYSFLIYHKEYLDFLHDLQDLGVVHIIEKQSGEIEDEELKANYGQLKEIKKTIQFLKKRVPEENRTGQVSSARDGQIVLDEIKQKREKLEQNQQMLVSLNKDIQNLEPWGEFSYETMEDLRKAGIIVRFFSCSAKRLDESWAEKYHLEIINQVGNVIYFVIIQYHDEQIDIDAEEFKLSEKNLETLRKEYQETEKSIEEMNIGLDNIAREDVPVLEKYREKLLSETDFKNVILNTEKSAEDKLMILEGWIPKTKEKDLNQFLEKQEIHFIVDKPKKEDKVPILLKNKKFSKLFEPIGKLYSLPNYAELDLTPFFAPFFMLFFGFCLGDAGYGLLFVIGATIYKFKAKSDFKPMLTLVQYLGLSTVVFGILSGTFFGINLLEKDLPIFSSLKSMMLDPNQMFYFAIVLGAIQIVYGMIVKILNTSRQFGFKYALSTLGWVILMVSSALYFGLGKESSVVIKYAYYIVLGISGIFIMFLNNPDKGFLANFGSGFGDIYFTSTGVLGDLLSYIRLFALGISSAILGYVFNFLAMKMSGDTIIVSQIIFIVILLVGHGINIFMATLGAFVHPLRLTFVEFYKNAGFAGGGKEYKPFKSN